MVLGLAALSSPMLLGCAVWPHSRHPQHGKRKALESMTWPVLARARHQMLPPMLACVLAPSPDVRTCMRAAQQLRALGIDRNTWKTGVCAASGEVHVSLGDPAVAGVSPLMKDSPVSDCFLHHLLLCQSRDLGINLCEVPAMEMLSCFDSTHLGGSLANVCSSCQGDRCAA